MNLFLSIFQIGRMANYLFWMIQSRQLFGNATKKSRTDFISCQNGDFGVVLTTTGVVTGVTVAACSMVISTVLWSPFTTGAIFWSPLIVPYVEFVCGTGVTVGTTGGGVGRVGIGVGTGLDELGRTNTYERQVVAPLPLEGMTAFGKNPPTAS